MWFLIRLEKFMLLSDVKLSAKNLSNLEIVYQAEEITEIHKEKEVDDQGYKKKVLVISEKKEIKSHHIKNIDEKLDFSLPRGKSQILTNIPELVQNLQHFSNADVKPLGEEMTPAQIQEYAEQKAVIIAIPEKTDLGVAKTAKGSKPPAKAKKPTKVTEPPKDEGEEEIEEVEDEIQDEEDEDQTSSTTGFTDSTVTSNAESSELNITKLNIVDLTDEQKAKLAELGLFDEEE